MTEFIPGLELNRIFFEEGVKPILAAEFPNLTYAAARIGGGSEVLGYDDVTSTDHDWGPRLQLFLREDDKEAVGTAVDEAFSRYLPRSIQGYSTHFGPADDEGTRIPEKTTEGPIAHRIEIVTVRGFLQDFLGYDPILEPTVAQWFLFPQQLLLGVMAGQVYSDHVGMLTAVRERLAYYPRDVWLYLLAAQWVRIGQEEAFMGRTGQVGDELGSRLIAARLVHDIMLLCFLMERRYSPYPKWFGTAFGRLKCADRLEPLLERVLSADGWQSREKPMTKAWELVAEMHNDLAISEPIPTAVSYYHGWPFRVISADRFVSAIKEQIADEQVKNITTNVGGIDQFSHSTDLRSYPRLHKHLHGLYQDEEDG